MRPADFYEGVAARYDASCHERFYRSLAEQLLDRVPEGVSVRSVLEVGAGTGFGTAVLRERFPAADITAVEPSTAMLDLARRRAPDVRHVSATLAEADLEVGYDLVACFVAAHWLTAAEWSKLVALSADGLLVVSLPRSASGATRTGNECLRGLLRRIRSKGEWPRRVRRVGPVRDAIEAEGRRVTSVDVELVETYLDAASLATSLFERGALLALFGDHAQHAADRLVAEAPHGPLELAWPFTLLVVS